MRLRINKLLSKIIVLAIFFSIILSVCCITVVKFDLKYPSINLQLSGQSDYIAEDVKNSISSLIKNNLFFINLNHVQQKLYNNNPWIKEVIINKLWPNTLKLDLTLHVPIARWNKEFLLTSSGKMLPLAVGFNNNLPEFCASIGQEQELLEKYYMLLEKLTPLGLFISKIEIMTDRNIQLYLYNNCNNNIIIKLGTIDLVDRIDRFMIIYRKKLQSIISDIAYIDIRYTNGVAVGWTKKGGELVNVQKR